MNKTEMTPELQAESDQVFAYWKREGLFEQALVYCLIEEKGQVPLVVEAAKVKFQTMYDEAVKALGLTPVLPAPIAEDKPKYVWRNGARVKVP